MSESYPTTAERRGWHDRGASTPTRPLAAGGCSARGLLALLASRGDEPAVTAREALAAALAAGKLDAIREAMDAARALVPQPTPADLRDAHLAALNASVGDHDNDHHDPEGDAA